MRCCTAGLVSLLFIASAVAAGQIRNDAATTGRSSDAKGKTFLVEMRAKALGGDFRMAHGSNGNAVRFQDPAAAGNF